VLKRLSFRAKLLLVLFVPFLALVTVSAAGLSDRFSRVRAQEQYGSLNRALVALGGLSRSLENEAVISAWYEASGGAPTGDLLNAQVVTNNSALLFRQSIQAFVDAGFGPDAIEALRVTDQQLEGRFSGRDTVNKLEPGVSGVPQLLDLDQRLLSLGTVVARDLSDRDAAAALTRTYLLEQSQHELAREAAAYVRLAAGEPATNPDQWVSAIAGENQYETDYVNQATAAEREAYSSAMEDAPPPQLGVAPGPLVPLPTAWPAAQTSASEYIDAYGDRAEHVEQAIARVRRQTTRAADARAADARSEVWLYGGGAVLAMLLTLGLIWFVSRAVVRPVRKLTEAARDMSERRLPRLVESLRSGTDVDAVTPEPIVVSSKDEIGDLARAFNDVEAVATDVARQQVRLLRKGMGDLFVNLARRNQSLLERQLELLDELERNEPDPAALDALFKLDHMSTRMRRNAESLLVLSGAEQPRQWQHPIALIDVVRAAAAEIADFPRVELVGVDGELAVQGRAVADLAHLLAELLENATAFSPPDAPVVVSGASTERGFVLAVADRGIGMPPDRMAQANQLLARPPLVGLALSRALGLHVVGALAARHRIHVELRAGAPVGTVALVMLPNAVLERPQPAAAPEHSAGAPAPAPRLAHESVTERAVTVPPVPEAPAARPAAARPTRVEPEPERAAPRVEWRPTDEPPIEQWRREHHEAEPTTTAPAGASGERNTHAGPSEQTRENLRAAAPPTVEAEDPAEPVEYALPTRMPGSHLRHEPASAPVATDPIPEFGRRADGPGDGADPMRPYRVHELLSRHAMGKRRGRAVSHPADERVESPAFESDPTGSGEDQGGGRENGGQR
jgi:signal transduction histidine kinase